MIEMQKSGQQEVVSEPRELETVLSEQKKTKLNKEKEHEKVVTMETVIHDVDEILVGLSDAIEEKRQESTEKMRKKNQIKSEKAHRNHVFMSILTGGSIVAILGVLYCLIINLKEENQHNFLA